MKWKSCKLTCKIIDCFHLTIFISDVAKKLTRKKSEEDEQTSKELNSAHRQSQAKCQLVWTSYIKQIKLFLFLPYNKHLINWAKSVGMGESWPWSCVYMHAVCTYDLGQYSPIQTSCSVKVAQNSFQHLDFFGSL